MLVPMVATDPFSSKLKKPCLRGAFSIFCRGLWKKFTAERVKSLKFFNEMKKFVRNSSIE